MESMDREDSPVESNDSDSEEVAVDREKALTEKEKVRLAQQQSKTAHALFGVLRKCDNGAFCRGIDYSKKGSTMVPLNVTPGAWEQTLSTQSCPPTELPASSDRKSKCLFLPHWVMSAIRARRPKDLPRLMHTMFPPSPSSQTGLYLCR